MSYERGCGAADRRPFIFYCPQSSNREEMRKGEEKRERVFGISQDSVRALTYSGIHNFPSVSQKRALSQNCESFVFLRCRSTTAAPSSHAPPELIPNKLSSRLLLTIFI
jgi:hypothetical protein